jgi:AraC-like DNA-binding protein
LDLESLNIQNLKGLGRSHYRSAQKQLPPHMHPGVIEICYLAAGKQMFEIAGTPYHLRGGDVLVSQPDELHTTAGRPMERSVLYWLLIEQGQSDNTFFDQPAPEGSMLRDRLLNMGTCAFPGEAKLQPILDEVFATFFSDSPFRPTRIRMLVLGFLLHLVELSEQSKPTETSSAIIDCQAAIDNHLQESISLEWLAEQAGLSLSRFKQRFAHEVGIPPREYILRRKIALAKQKLRGGNSVTRVAFELSFSSSQYFATTFRRYTGQSPSEFRKSLNFSTIN